MAGTTHLIRNLNRLGCGSNISVRGWIRSIRRHKDTSFIVVNDGTNRDGVQIVYKKGDDVANELTNGAAVDINGTLVQCPSSRHNSDREVIAESIRIVGPCHANEYPVQKKYHTNEFLRRVQHLRGRTADFSSTMRVRSSAAQAIHQFFNDRDYKWIHAPILTASDCEGAGEVFEVTPASDSKSLTSDDGGFFGTRAYLTVSAQLHAEMFACSIGPVYTFGPTFRSENSNTSRHLAEFWMVEPEIPYANLDVLCDTAEQLVKHCVTNALTNDESDLDHLLADNDEARTSLRTCSESDFARVTYSDAIQILQKCSMEFQHEPVWGNGLQTEHELYLASQYFKRPVFITDYPTAIKPFYMKKSSDSDKTVACLDLLLPKIGEVVGGSERIDDSDELIASMKAHNIDDSKLDWYIDLRRFGSIPHGGFGLGFDRLIQFICGIPNIRDVVPVPRVPGSCPY